MHYMGCHLIHCLSWEFQESLNVLYAYRWSICLIRKCCSCDSYLVLYGTHSGYSRICSAAVLPAVNSGRAVFYCAVRNYCTTLWQTAPPPQAHDPPYSIKQDIDDLSAYGAIAGSGMVGINIKCECVKEKFIQLTSFQIQSSWLQVVLICIASWVLCDHFPSVIGFYLM